MKGFKIANLDTFMSAIGEEATGAILADYLCPLNPDVEHFLRHSAIPFSRQGLAKTFLVFAGHQDQCVLVGYFSLAYKTFLIRRSRALNAKLRSRIRKFARVIDEANAYEISAPLIAQLGKNFANGYNCLISGDELLKLACDKVQETQALVGGRIAYLECEDRPQLVAFYERNGFSPFDRRQLEKTDRDIHKSDYLVQMIRYFSANRSDTGHS